MPRGLFNPKNYAPEVSGSFKEGFIRVDQSAFKVQKPAYEGRSAYTALVWKVTRLDEDLNPLTDGNDEPVSEELAFSLGGKSLGSVHPGQADSPSDEEIEDLGDAAGTEGNTLHFVNQDFQVNAKSGISKLMDSLRKAGFKEDPYLNREWAPDFVGLVAFMKTDLDQSNLMRGNDGKERPTPYKVVDKIVRAPYEKSGKPVLASAPKPGKNADAEGAIKPILEAIADEKTGETMERKAFNLLVTQKLQKSKIPSTQHVSILTLVKDQAWLAKNAPHYGISYDPGENTVSFL